MQETEDIVTRLQNERRATRWTRGVDTDYPVAWEPHPLCAEAATTIATLRAEVDKLRAELKLCGKDNCMGRRVKGVTQWVTEQAKDAAVAAVRAEVEVLRADAEALRWADEHAAYIDLHGDPDNFVRIWHGPAGKSSTSGKTLRAAIDAAKAG